MDPQRKYDLLLNIAMIIGFGGFILMAALIYPKLGADNIWSILITLVWVGIVCWLLTWRYRIAKSSEEIQKLIRKDAQAFAEKLEKKQARKGYKKGERRGMYNEKLWQFSKDEEPEGDSETAESSDSESEKKQDE